MAKRGAKSKYEKLVQPYLKEINDKVRQGVTEEQIAKALGISVASLNNYRNKYQEFREALSKDKGADVLNSLINAGIEAATGCFKTNVQTVYGLDEDGKVIVKQIVENKQWQAPNAALNKFYVSNLGKDKGFTNDPLQYELAKAKQEFTEKMENAKNWDITSEGEKDKND